MGAVSVLIVDDEAPARALVREYLAEIDGYQVAAECANGFEAVEAVARLAPDLLLLDVQMPGLDGFEVLELLDREVGVVFTTAYDEYAVRAFEVGAVDYLLKPFSRDRLAEALARAAARRGAGSQEALARLTSAAQKQRSPLTRVLARAEGEVHVLPVEKIDYVEAQGDYAVFRAGARKLSKQQSLTELEELLDPARFARIHRSYILNLARLARFELYAKDSRVAVLADGTRLPVSRAGYARVKEKG
jgi:two-component system LytT family response regulator